MAIEDRTTLDSNVSAWTPLLDLETTHKPDVRDFIESATLRAVPASRPVRRTRRSSPGETGSATAPVGHRRRRPWPGRDRVREG